MKQFTPTYLYIKQHLVTGLLYFGKTIQNPEKYLGSGKHWVSHFKKHGKQHIVNLWYCLFLDEDSIKQFASTFSTTQNIVESKSWANLTPENGTDGGPRNNNHFKSWSKLPKSSHFKKQRSITSAGNKNHAMPVLINGVTYQCMRDAAKSLNVVEMTIYNWVKSGKAIKL